MEDNKRFTIMTFPQHFDGSKMKVNILFLPRNQNPFSNAIEVNATIPKAAPPFVDANLAFVPRIVRSLEEFPNNLNATTGDVLTIKIPATKKQLFQTLADPEHFNIDNLNASNAILTTSNAVSTPLPSSRLKKYLPLTYRQSFNFISPKLPGNAVTDDSYQCAVRGATMNPAFVQSPNTVSWGKVFGYVLRHPVLSRQAGFVYETTFDVDASLFEKGGWLYINLADASDYKAQQQADDDFIKKYAARIPELKAGEARSLFAANQFPVLFKNPADLVDPVPKGSFDNIFIEAADYDDGFAKIVHAFQPVSQNLLAEESDGFHPAKESGIRLGWDDEQILAWYLRQMCEDASIGQRLDAPIGVMGYYVDVKEKDAATWQSLNEVKSKLNIDLIGDGGVAFEGELPYLVYPSTLDGQPNSTYWLPMYFANWSGKSMVLPDADAIKIYQHDQDVKPDTKTNVDGAPKNNLLKQYDAVGITTKLEYGSIHDFRVRLTDITHGGPLQTDDAIHGAVSPVARCHFKRYVAPAMLRIEDVPFNDDEALYDKPELKIKRPLLGYPAVALCNKYVDPVTKLVTRLQQQIDDAKAAGTKIQLEDLGLSDPDVDSIEITVEVQSLKMDYQLSTSGKEAYALFYTTTRKFAKPLNEDDYDKELSIPIQFKDAPVLKFGDPADLGDDFELTQAELDDMDEIVLPTARQIRLTLRAVCEEKAGYYGSENGDKNFNTRYGRTSYVTLYQPSVNEKNLLLPASSRQLQAIYLQPHAPSLIDNVKTDLNFISLQPPANPGSVQRLAQQLRIESNGLTLTGKKGQRIQFGCSARIRHTLSPEHSSLTFATKADLYNHWLCCITLQINRDWSWDALQDLSFIIKRTSYFKQQPELSKEEIVGEVEVKRTVSFNALQNPERSYTTLIFIDAVEPKNEDATKFPDLIEVSYTVSPQFKKDHGATSDGDLTLESLELPVTIIPAQIPKIVSAGIALSPYRRNAKYSSTEPRRRFVWIEFEEPLKDTNNLYFARILSYAPDQLLSNNDINLDEPKEDPLLNIDSEFIRVITHEQSDDESGLNAMQPLEKSLLSDRHYLLPLPAGLNESSPELFGFFTYEFRVGHAKIWSTAQARFGRPLKCTGVQHPAPTLTCAVNRDEQKIYVSAPYATTVYEGKNVTAYPPRTELWCLLYAQVKQADNNDATKELKDYRNILLDDRKMIPALRFNHPERIVDQPNNIGVGTVAVTDAAKKIASTLEMPEANADMMDLSGILQLIKQPTDKTIYATTFWTSVEINKLLLSNGLPVDLPLSVLCVEVFINITNEAQLRTRRYGRFAEMGVNFNSIFDARKPLSRDLGNYRVLRTSPLAEVPFVCCTM